MRLKIFVYIEMLDYTKRRLFQNGKPIESTMALTRKDFKLACEMMAISIMQGGQAPNLMSPQIFNYLCGNLSVSQINSTPHRELCEKVTDVKFFMNTKFAPYGPFKMIFLRFCGHYRAICKVHVILTPHHQQKRIQCSIISYAFG